MRWFINRGSRFFAFLYLFWIIGFAALYCTLPNQFYQSNRDFEKYNSDNKEQKDFLYDEILREATTGIVERFNNKFADTFIVSNNYSLYSGDIRITDFKFENGYFIFTLVSNPYKLTQRNSVTLKFRTELNEQLSDNSIWKSKYKSTEYKIAGGNMEFLSFILNVLFSSKSLKELDQFKYGITDSSNDFKNPESGSGNNPPNIKITTSSPPDMPWLWFIDDYYGGASGSNTGSGTALSHRNIEDSIMLGQFGPMMGDKLRSQVYRKYFFDKIFALQNLDFKHGEMINYSLTFPISESLNNNLKSYALGLTNDPKTFSGKLELFLKMLYFSIITIATLGYGDIVPITSLARLLVSVEVILGILTIGLFLNSLATRITKKNN